MLTKEGVSREVAYITLSDRIRHGSYVGEGAVETYRRDLEKLYGVEGHEKAELLWKGRLTDRLPFPCLMKISRRMKPTREIRRSVSVLCCT